MTFGSCPFLIGFSLNVSHWASKTHRRYTAGFYYGAPWHAAIRTNVFRGGEACLTRKTRIAHFLDYVVVGCVACNARK